MSEHKDARALATTPMTLLPQERYISLTMEFRCNLKCVHCMIEGTMDRLQPQSMETFNDVCAENRNTGRFDGLILTGSEITLRRDLPELARKARDSGFRHVRIQTHGMHLSRERYVRELVEAGVDEYFVSVAGDDAASHDRITQVPGAFDKMMASMALLDNYRHVKLLTNTVVTAQSHTLLTGVVDALAHLRQLVQMEFWVYWPMNERDEKNLLVHHSALRPHLLRAVEAAQGLGRRVEVKNFPHCMMGEHGDVLVNDQPLLLIDPDFWREFERNGFYRCAFRDECGSTECLGLSTAYTERFGWDREILTPLPRGREQH